MGKEGTKAGPREGGAIELEPRADPEAARGGGGGKGRGNRGAGAGKVEEEEDAMAGVLGAIAKDAKVGAKGGGAYKR
jgi:hypothetical protein